jgi:hypothetical protein
MKKVDNKFLIDSTISEHKKYWIKFLTIIFLLGIGTNSYTQLNNQKINSIILPKQNLTNLDSIIFNGTIINSITNKPLTYPILVQFKTSDSIINSCVSGTDGCFKNIIINKINLKSIDIILNYQNIENDTIQVPKEHFTLEQTKEANVYELIIRTAINTKKIGVQSVLSKTNIESNIIYNVNKVKVRFNPNLPKGDCSNALMIVKPGGTPANLESNDSNSNPKR